MRIAILGATSQIARDLIVSFSAATQERQLYLYARRPEAVKNWLDEVGIGQRYLVDDFSQFSRREYDAIINFVGVGNPAQLVAMGNTIFEITARYDQMAIDYLHVHPKCKYLFMSSGAAYGSNFSQPVDSNSPAVIPINALTPVDWYGVAKLHAECRHRALPELSIFDIRVFNYFSRSQDIEAKYLITDILRAIVSHELLKTSESNIFRDYLHPRDFCKLIEIVLSLPGGNMALDCFSGAPIAKLALLSEMASRFGLVFELTPEDAGMNATGSKLNYYSLNRRAGELGYKPVHTSISGLFEECEAMLDLYRQGIIVG